MSEGGKCYGEIANRIKEVEIAEVWGVRSILLEKIQ